MVKMEASKVVGYLLILEVLVFSGSSFAQDIPSRNRPPGTKDDPPGPPPPPPVTRAENLNETVTERVTTPPPMRTKPTRRVLLPSTTPVVYFESPAPTQYRLVNAEGEPGMGIVEAYFNDTWGSVCHNSKWTEANVNVLCRSLGYERGSTSESRYYPAPPPPTPTTTRPPAEKEEEEEEEKEGLERGPVRPVPTEPEPRTDYHLAFRCLGNESNLADCPGNWVHYNYVRACYRPAAAVCLSQSVSDGGIEKVRLVLPNNYVPKSDMSVTGQVEVFHRGRWGIICDNTNSFLENEVQTLCGSLGYTGGYKMTGNIFYFRRNYTVVTWLQNIRCSGVYDNLNQCLGESYVGDASSKVCTSVYTAVVVTCNNIPIDYPAPSSVITDIRLVNVTEAVDPREWKMGRVELQVAGSGWGTICESRRYSSRVWYNSPAQDMCQRLGYSGGIAIKSSVFGRENATVITMPFICDEYSRSFADCRSQLEAPSSCSVGGGGVFCYNNSTMDEPKPNITIRLVGKPDVHTKKVKAGRVEYFNLGLWGPVCQKGWDLREAYVVCKQLGFKDGYPLCNSTFGKGYGPPWLSDLVCAGNEKDLKDCLDWQGQFLERGGCPASEQAGVQCVDHEPEGRVSVRLVDKNEKKTSKDLNSGVVEVLYKGHWGTICSKNWDDMDAKVVCRQLGFITGVAKTNLTIGIGTTMVWLNDVDCKGSESSIDECRNDGWATNTCSPACEHSSDAGVLCSGKRKDPEKTPKGDNDIENVPVVAKMDGNDASAPLPLTCIVILLCTLSLFFVKR